MLNGNYRFKYKNYKINIGINNITNHKNYYWIDPSNIIYHNYMFEFEEAKVPAVGRKIYLSIGKSW